MWLDVSYNGQEAVTNPVRAIDMRVILWLSRPTLHAEGSEKMILGMDWG